MHLLVQVIKEGSFGSLTERTMPHTSNLAAGRWLGALLHADAFRGNHAVGGRLVCRDVTRLEMGVKLLNVLRRFIFLLGVMVN